MTEVRKSLKIVENPHRFMTTIYVVSLAVIAMLSIATHFVLQTVIDKQSNTGIFVNKSGQQRMLSQRTSMFAIEYIKTGNEEAKLLTLSALQAMEENHKFLTKAHFDSLKQNQASPMSDQMQALYFQDPVNIDKQIKQFRNYVVYALDHRPKDNEILDKMEKPFFEMAKKPFLDDLDAAVLQYEQESLLDIAELSLAQNVVLAIVILTILLEAVFVFRPMVARISLFAKQLQYEANYDHLSNIYNRRAFFMITEKLIQYAYRYNKPFCIVLLDIDKFKSINDEYGHDIGDTVIFNLAQLLTKELRASDIVARFGGEEFIIFMPETSQNNALLAAEKIKTSIENYRFSENDASLKVTVSMGVAERTKSDNLEAVIKRADESLYKAKSNGRNQVYGSD